MAKIVCECGYEISDTTDFNPHIARFIADQDYFDFLAELEERQTKESHSVGRYFGELFQCPDCGNLIVFSASGSRRYDFRPIGKDQDQKLTRSALGERWKGVLIGHFYGEQHTLAYKRGKGELFWNTNKDSGSLQDLTLEELRKTYAQKFEELSQQQILRSSFLSIDGTIAHSWPKSPK